MLRKQASQRSDRLRTINANRQYVNPVTREHRTEAYHGNFREGRRIQSKSVDSFIRLLVSILPGTVGTFVCTKKKGSPQWDGSHNETT